MQCFLGPAVQPRCQLRAVPSMQRWNTPRHPAAMCPLVCGGPARARSMAWARQHQHADPYMHQGTVFCLPLPIGTTLPPLPCLLSVRTARPPTRRPPARLPACPPGTWLAGWLQEGAIPRLPWLTDVCRGGQGVRGAPPRPDNRGGGHRLPIPRGRGAPHHPQRREPDGDLAGMWLACVRRCPPIPPLARCPVHQMPTLPLQPTAALTSRPHCPHGSPCCRCWQ